MSILSSVAALLTGLGKPDRLGPPPPMPDVENDPELVRLKDRVKELRRRAAASLARASAARAEAGLVAEKMAGLAGLLLHAESLPPDDGPAPASPEDLRLKAQRHAEEAEAYNEAAAKGDQAIAELRGRLVSRAVRAEGGLDAWARRAAAEQARRLCEAARLAQAEERLQDAVAAAGGTRETIPFRRFEGVSIRPGPDQSQLQLWLYELCEAGVLTGEEPWLAGTGVGAAEMRAANALARREAAARRADDVAREAAKG